MKREPQLRPIHFAYYDPDAKYGNPRARDRHAPIPCDYSAAIKRAMELREGPGGNAFSYRAIAIIMAQYHGWHRAPGWWKQKLVRAGATPRPRGMTLAANRAKSIQESTPQKPRGLAGYLAGVYDGPGGTNI